MGRPPEPFRTPGREKGCRPIYAASVAPASARTRTAGRSKPDTKDRFLPRRSACKDNPDRFRNRSCRRYTAPLCGRLRRIDRSRPRCGAGTPSSRKTVAVSALKPKAPPLKLQVSSLVITPLFRPLVIERPPQPRRAQARALVAHACAIRDSRQSIAVSQDSGRLEHWAVSVGMTL